VLVHLIGSAVSIDNQYQAKIAQHVVKEYLMSENPNPQPDLTSQFRDLGDQLKNLLQTAWDSDEAQQVKEELKIGMHELGRVATEAVEDFKTSEIGEKLKTEAEDFKSRVDSGEVEIKARDEISKALNMINTELQKAIDSFKPPAEPEA